MSDLLIETIDQVTVVYLSGYLNALIVRQIEPQISELNQSGNKIILHLGAVEFMSSLGLWMLFSLQRQMKDRKGKLVVVAVPEVVKEILTLVGFSSVIQTFTTLEEGLVFLIGNR